MNQGDYNEEIERYLQGRMPKAEREAFEAKMAGDPALAEEWENLRAQRAFLKFTADQAWEKRFDEWDRAMPSPVKKQRRQYKWWIVAGGIATLGWVYCEYIHRQESGILPKATIELPLVSPKPEPQAQGAPPSSAPSRWPKLNLAALRKSAGRNFAGVVDETQSGSGSDGYCTEIRAVIQALGPDSLRGALKRLNSLPLDVECRWTRAHIRYQLAQKIDDSAFLQAASDDFKRLAGDPSVLYQASAARNYIVSMLLLETTKAGFEEILDQLEKDANPMIRDAARTIGNHLDE